MQTTMDTSNDNIQETEHEQKTHHRRRERKNKDFFLPETFRGNNIKLQSYFLVLIQ
jgi:hypothetical protein